jgi:hypothetical protein
MPFAAAKNNGVLPCSSTANETTSLNNLRHEAGESLRGGGCNSPALGFAPASSAARTSETSSYLRMRVTRHTSHVTRHTSHVPMDSPARVEQPLFNRHLHLFTCSGTSLHRLLPQARVRGGGSPCARRNMGSHDGKWRKFRRARVCM